ncbi:hypothetical protein [uncultured Intestinimonas sp.]|uniref:hypothetical protein n=1 Tax=uncultured Intestinimonas sp. TaxID=1689265 RepID=UPI0025FF6CB8|nr:hypothetical protein [uncultured Intestinimonas sp.]
MELRYNLTPQDLRKGLALHEGRVRGGLTAVRTIERLFFLLMTGASVLILAMGLVLLAAGAWEEDFTAVFAFTLATLLVSLLFLWLLSPRRRARAGAQMLAREESYLGPRSLSLTEKGVAVSYGSNRRLEPYAAISQVWEKKGYCLLYVKEGVWEVLPPCAFTGPEQRTAFLAALARARAGQPPQSGEGVVLEGPVMADAAFVLRYTWEPEELHEALLMANKAYCRTRLYWRPATVLMALLSIPVLLVGILALIGVLTSGAEPAEVLMTVGILLLGVALCLVWINFLPPVLDWSIRRQEKKEAFRHLLGGQLTERIGPAGVDSAREGERERTLWSQIGAVRSEEWGLALFRHDRKMLLFPPWAFSSRDEQEQAAAYAREQIGKS